MKFIIAATFAAAASADLASDIENGLNEVACALWKSGVATSKGLTAETDSNNNVTYKAAEGAEFTAWSGEDGYGDSKCAEVDGAAYVTAGAAMAVAVAALAF